MDNCLDRLSFKELLKLLRLLAAYEHYDGSIVTPTKVQKWWDIGVTADVVEAYIMDRL